MRFLCLILAIVLSANSVKAGTLQDFEKDAIKSVENHEKRTQHSPESDTSTELGSLLGEILILPFAMGIEYGGINSWHRASGKSEEPRHNGDALLSILRIDGSYQNVEDDVNAFDLRGEAGYGPIGLQARHTRYREEHPSDTLTVTQAHLLYRMSFGSQVELDLGLGALILDGAETTSGFSSTLPLLVHPTENFGFEFRPAWANLNGNTIQDYDLAVILGTRNASLKLGYRWFLSEHKSLNGPQAGIVLRW